VQVRKLIVGNTPPYGYRYVKKDRERGAEGHYEIEPDEARVVRMMFNWVANEGLTQRAVIRRLLRLRAPSRKGQRWATSSIHKVLSNETYAGTTYYGKHECISGRPLPAGVYRRDNSARRRRDRAEWLAIPLPPDLHIISRELFTRAQNQLARNAAHARRNAKRLFLLREVRKTCAVCGYTLAGTTHHQTRYYRCRGRDHLQLPLGKERCSSTLVNAERIERLTEDLDAHRTYLRRKTQGPILVLKTVPGHLWNLAYEANETFCRGLFRASIAVCRAMLEYVVKQVARAGSVITREFRVALDQVPDGILSPDERKLAGEIYDLGNLAVHDPKYPLDEDRAHETLQNTATLIEAIINRGGLIRR